MSDNQENERKNETTEQQNRKPAAFTSPKRDDLFATWRRERRPGINGANE